MAAKAPQPDEAEQLRELIRQGHEILKDLKNQERQARDTVRELVFGILVEETNTQLTAAYQALRRRVDDAEETIKQEFEDIRDAYMMGHGSELPTVEEFMIAQKVIEFIMAKVRQDQLHDPKSIVTMSVVERTGDLEARLSPVLTTADLEEIRKSGPVDSIAHIKLRPKESE